MAANSAIEWTGRTHQFTAGCLHKSSGCAHCYAETLAYRLACMARDDIAKGRDPGKKRRYLEIVDLAKKGWNGRVVPLPENLDEPFAWKAPQTVFVDSMSDLFYGDEQDKVRCEAKAIDFTPVPFDFLDHVYSVFALTQKHTYQVLTKRPGRMRDYLAGRDLGQLFATVRAEYLSLPVLAPATRLQSRLNIQNCAELDDPPWPLPNVWLGTSIENQNAAEERIPDLVSCPTAVRFLSCEPLLGQLDLTPWLLCPHLSFTGEACDQCGVAWSKRRTRVPLIHWVIVGGESGPGARVCDLGWIRSIVAQCKAAGVRVFVKQLGARPTGRWQVDGCSPYPADHWTLRDKKGGDWNEWPSDVRVREYPSHVGAAAV